jgi:hypothetical protein
MSRVADIARALADIGPALTRAAIPYMIIGGLANAMWGRPRATRDIDITVAMSSGEMPRLLAILGDRVGRLPDDIEALVAQSGVLPLFLRGGVRVDFLFTTNGYQLEAIERAAALEIDGQQVRFCTAEDLVLHKLVSERTKDREDVVALLRLRRDRLDRSYLDARVHELAGILGEPALEARYLALMDR